MVVNANARYGGGGAAEQNPVAAAMAGVAEGAAALSPGPGGADGEDREETAY